MPRLKLLKLLKIRPLKITTNDETAERSQPQEKQHGVGIVPRVSPSVMTLFLSSSAFCVGLDKIIQRCGLQSPHLSSTIS